MTQNLQYVRDRVLVDARSGCWLWQRFINDGGYGTAYWKAEGRAIVAHRLSWMLATGRRIPPGYVIHHKCHVRPCVNPEHLRLVTQRENGSMQRPTHGRYGTPPARKKMYPWPATIDDLKLRSTEDRKSGCWVWQQALTSGGYGHLWRPRPERRVEQAHRVAWELSNGAIPTGLVVDHPCFNRACINPDHLQLLSHGDNVRRKQTSTSLTCRRGHLWSQHAAWEKTGRRYCGRCKRELKAARGDHRPRKTSRRHNVIATEQLVQLRAEGLSQSQIGVVVGMTQGNVGKRLRRHDSEQAGASRQTLPTDQSRRLGTDLRIAAREPRCTRTHLDADAGGYDEPNVQLRSPQRL